MHPYLLETFAHDRAAAMHQSAAARSKRQPQRQRIGWMLVTVGLRLVGDGAVRRRPAPIGG